MRWGFHAGLGVHRQGACQGEDVHIYLTTHNTNFCHAPVTKYAFLTTLTHTAHPLRLATPSLVCILILMPIAIASFAIHTSA